MSLKQQAFKAGRWTAISALLVASLQLLQLIFLARLLTPADFGLMAVTAAFLAILTLFADLGLSRAIIHFENIPPDALCSLYWLNLVMGVLLMLALIAAAPLLGSLFGYPGLVPVLQIISLALPLTALGQQFRVIAEKQLRFRTVAENEIVAAVLGFSIAIGVALNGGGVYALVAGVLATAAAGSTLAFIRLSQGYRPGLCFRLKSTYPYLRFGGYMVGETLANMLQRQADIFIGGLISSPGALGIFSVPRDLSLRATLVINPILTRVGFPVMSQVKNDREKLKSIYLQILRMTASVNFPIYIALGLFSREVIVLLFGERWLDSAVYLQIFAAFGLFRSTSNPIGSLLYAVGHGKHAFWWNIALLVILPLAFLVGASLGGLVGLALSILISHIAIFIPLWFFLVRPACGANLREYYRPFIPPLCISLAAFGSTFIAISGFESGHTRLALGLAMGGIIYLLLSAWFNRPWITALRELSPLKR